MVTPDREATARAHLLEGAALLMGAETRPLGLLVHIDRSRVTRGLRSLSRVLEISKDHELRATSLWLTAKAHLMLGEAVQAGITLQNDEILKSRRGSLAAKYLKLLEGQEPAL
jgi:hypothetical protein